MCDYPPPPSLFAALLAAPWLLVAAGAIICLLGLCLIDLRTQRHAGRERTGLPGASGAVLIGYSGVALVAIMLVSSLAWRAALMDWDVSQIGRLERAGCFVPTLEAVDGLFGQQLSTANTLLQLGAIGALAAIVFLLVRLVRRPPSA